MLRTFDIILVVVMTAAATVTYSIKHRAELKLEEVRKIESEIRLERDTIDLLKADWALLTQPNRLQRLVDTYQATLQLVPTASTQLARPSELPMLKADVPPPPEPKGKDGKPLPMADASKPGKKEDGIAQLIKGGEAAIPAEKDAAAAQVEEAPVMSGDDNEMDGMATGSVEQ